MPFKLIFIAGLLIIAFSANVFGQSGLPWLKSEQPKAPEAKGVLESQLPLARARLEGSGVAWVGQAVPLNIEVIVPSWFTGPPRFPELEVPNAVTLSPEAAVNFVVQSAGKSFSAQGRRYLIFPQIKGKYIIPSDKIEVTYALPDGRSSAPKYLPFPSLKFEARVPTGAEGAKYFLTTNGFNVDQSFDRKLKGLKVGDSITRTINMKAEDTVGMTLPVLSFEVPEGIRLYTGVPRVSEKAERGKIEASRTETATYVLEKEGHYKILEIVIMWWDPQKRAMNKARLPAVELQVEGNSDYNAEVFASSEDVGGKPTDEPKRTIWGRLKLSLPWVLMILGAFLVFLIIRRILLAKGFSLRSYIAERRKQRANAETTYFKRFRKTSLSNDTRATLTELMCWLDRVNTQPEASTFERFAKQTEIPDLFKEGDTLQRLLFASPGKIEPIEFQREWSGKSFYKLVAQARRLQIRRSNRRNRRKDDNFSLNPISNEGSFRS